MKIEDRPIRSGAPAPRDRESPEMAVFTIFTIV